MAALPIAVEVDDTASATSNEEAQQACCTLLPCHSRLFDHELFTMLFPLQTAITALRCSHRAVLGTEARNHPRGTGSLGVETVALSRALL